MAKHSYAQTRHSSGWKTPKWTVTFTSPLQWPERQKRTSESNRRRSPYRITSWQSVDELDRELSRWGATEIEISSEGEPLYNGTGLRDLKGDPGVCVTWNIGDDAFQVAADRYEELFANLTAIARQLAAIRQAERNGTSGALRKTIRKPPPVLEPNLKAKNCFAVLGLTSKADRRAVRAAYRKLALKHHPDLGGSNEDMRVVNEAYGKALAGASS